MHQSFFNKCCGWCIQASLLLASFAVGAAEFSLSVADIVTPDFSARGITLTLPEDGSADLRIAELHVRQRDLRKVQLHCAHFELSTASVSCRSGRLDAVPGMAVDFGYRFGDGSWQVAAQLRNVLGKSLGNLWPKDMPQLTQGALHGTLRISGNASGTDAFDADIQLAEVGFSDASDLHAAEKLRGSIKFAAARKAALWTWQGNLVWQSGEMFWQPLYLSGTGGRSLSASGSFDGAHLKVEQAIVDLPEAGRVQFTALWDVMQGTLVECSAHGSNLALEKLFDDYAKPFLDKGALAESHLYGHADVDWQ